MDSPEAFLSPANKGTLKMLYNGEVVRLPALVAASKQLPRSCGVLLGIPGLAQLGVNVDLHLLSAT
jgi:hypothetical protein